MLAPLRTSPLRVARPASLLQPWLQRRYAGTGRGTGKTILSHHPQRGDRQDWLHKISVSDKYPITAQIRENAAPSQRSAMVTHKNACKAHLRPQIVSPELCDDVLKLIGPSLEPYKGCDILDINPGAGVWSQKLHDFLQPRSHILLESPSDPFTPFLEPLTKTPGSTYKIVHADPCQWATYSRLIDDGHFPHQKRVDPAAPQELNTSLLVTGQLMWEPKMMGVGIDNMARQMLASFYKMNFTNEVFHAMGPARTLFWALADDVQGVLPQSASQRNKLNLILTETCEKLIAVAGPSVNQQGPRYGARAPRFLFESMLRTAQRAQENGIVHPEHRRDPVHSLLDDILRLSNGTGRLSTIEARDFLEAKFYAGFDITGLISGQHHDLWQQAKDLDAIAPPTAEEVAAARAARKGTKGGRPASEKNKAYAIKKASVKRVLAQELYVEAAANMAETVYNAEVAILRMPDGPEKDAAIKQLEEELKPQLTAARNKVNKNFYSRVATDSDERLLFDTPVPRLHWDTRPYEPLVINPEEVWPRLPVTLLDVTPRPRPAHMSRVDWEYFQDTIEGLSKNIDEDVLTALDRMQHGAAELVEQVPAMRDPDKGGRLDLANMHVRMLTGEMFEVLSKVYQDWPFKHPDANHPKYFRVRNRLTSGRHTTQRFK